MMLSPRALRLLTVAVLALNGIWLIMAIGSAIAAATNASFTVEIWMLSLYPGCAFIPALYYLVRRRRTRDPKRLRHFTSMAVILTLMGVVVLGYTIYDLVQMHSQ